VLKVKRVILEKTWFEKRMKSIELLVSSINNVKRQKLQKTFVVKFFFKNAFLLRLAFSANKKKLP